MFGCGGGIDMSQYAGWLKHCRAVNRAWGSHFKRSMMSWMNVFGTVGRNKSAISTGSTFSVLSVILLSEIQKHVYLGKCKADASSQLKAILPLLYDYPRVFVRRIAQDIDNSRQLIDRLSAREEWMEIRKFCKDPT